MNIAEPLTETQAETEQNGQQNNHPTPEREREFEGLAQEATHSQTEVEIKLPFHILGFNSQRQVLIWHKGKILPTPVAQLKPDDLKLLVGEQPQPAKDQISPYTLIKNKIIELAYEKGLVDDEEPIKSGIWKLKDGWVIVSGRRAALIKNDEFTFLETPVIDDRVIQFERGSWIDLDLLQRRIKKGKADLSATFEKVKKLVAQWYWVDSSMVDYVAAFLMLQLFQSAMRWRPWLYLLGAAHTGKSTFLDLVIERLFGCQVKRLDKSTGHAAAQALGSNSKIAIFDEFEKNKHMPSILENMKLSNRGGVVTSGTTGDNPKEYNLCHMPWFASIYLPRSFSSDQAQFSRVVKFELRKVPEGKSVAGLSDNEAQDLLCDIITSVLFAWPEIERNADSIEKKKGKFIEECGGKINGRSVENLMYSMALLGLVKNEPQMFPAWAINEVKDDGENILEAIVTAKIRFGVDEYFVIDLLNKVLGEPVVLDITEAGAKDLLRKHGLSVVNKSYGWALAVIPKDVVEHLFRTNSDYRGLDIKAPLERLGNVEKSVKTEWGNQTKLWAMHIPGRHINAIIAE